MNKYICILLTLITMSLLLVGCSDKTKIEEINPGPTINEFITKMYTVDDYTKIDIKNLNLTYPKDKYTNELRKVTTAAALVPIVNDRTQLLYITSCTDSHINSKVISAKIDKYLSQKDGSIVYNYEAKLKYTFPDENKQTDEEVSGQVTVKMVNSKWIITQINSTNIGNILKKYKQKY